MDQGVVDSPVTLVIRAPNQKYDDQTINCHQNWTVEKLKAHLSDVYPSKPVSDFAPVLSKLPVSVSMFLWSVLVRTAQDLPEECNKERPCLKIPQLQI